MKLKAAHKIKSGIHGIPDFFIARKAIYSLPLGLGGRGLCSLGPLGS